MKHMTFETSLFSKDTHVVYIETEKNFYIVKKLPSYRFRYNVYMYNKLLRIFQKLS